ncbi:hypothetical protein [Lacticaseibacillus pantheris]|jgi:hypothetical protein
MKQISEKFKLISKQELRRIGGGQAMKTYVPRGVNKLVNSIIKKIHIG